MDSGKLHGSVRPLSYPTVSLGSGAQPLAAKLLLHFNYYTWPPLLCRKLIYELSINSTLQKG